MQIIVLIKSQTNQKQTNNKKGKPKNTFHSSIFPTSLHHLFISVALGATVYREVYPFVHTAFSLCNVLLVRFKASDFRYTINDGASR